jgi:hypothetical protein
MICIDYFGQWPCWFEMFLLSCRANPTVNWCIHTDCKVPEEAPANVQFFKTTFSAYCERVSTTLGVTFRPSTTYNLCNLKPMYGYLYSDILKGFDYFGWGDLDVIYGDIRSILTSDILNSPVISTHKHICSGHLCLMKNDTRLREAFRLLPNWKERLENPSRFNWDESLTESHLTALFCPIDKTRILYCAKHTIAPPDSVYYASNYFVEQWSTPFTPAPWLDGSFIHPDVWFWQNGVLTNARDSPRTFLYLHLMNFAKKQWINTTYYKTSPTWDQLDTCMDFDIHQIGDNPDQDIEIQIDRSGIHLLRGRRRSTKNM